MKDLLLTEFKYESTYINQKFIIFLWKFKMTATGDYMVWYFMGGWAKEKTYVSKFVENKILLRCRVVANLPQFPVPELKNFEG